MLKLKRTTQNSKVTLGVLFISTNVKTLELPWRNNEKNISCIPAGRYKAVLHNSPKFGRCIKLLDVPERTDILIHAGNTTDDTEGCIIVGSEHIDNAVMSSRVALNKLLTIAELMSDDELFITIED